MAYRQDGLCYCGEPGSPGHAPHPPPDAKDKRIAELEQQLAAAESYMAELETKLAKLGGRLVRAVNLLEGKWQKARAVHLYDEPSSGATCRSVPEAWVSVTTDVDRVTCPQCAGLILARKGSE